MSKQDRQGVRTPADLERKYAFGETFAEFAGMIEETQEEAEQAAKDVTELDQKLNFDEIFRRLTADGRNPGMFIDKETGLVVFSCDYFVTGVIKSKDGNCVIDLDNGTSTLTTPISAEFRADYANWDESAMWEEIKYFLIEAAIPMKLGTVKNYALQIHGLSVEGGALVSLYKHKNGDNVDAVAAIFTLSDGTIGVMQGDKEGDTDDTWHIGDIVWKTPLKQTVEEYVDNHRFFTDYENEGYRNGLMYSGTPSNPLYVAVWDADDKDWEDRPNRRVRAATAEQVLSLINAAPGGYGYGGQAISLGYFTTEAALTTALASVYDAMGNNETKMVTYSGYPSNSDWRWFGILSRSSANNGSFVAHSVYNGGSKFIKQKYSGSWLPLEWENPPMLVGVEYRTTARHDGKPVYTKFIKHQFSGTIGSSSSYADYWISHGVTGWDRFIKAEANMGGTLFLPYLASQGGVTQIIQANATQGLQLRIYHDTWITPNFNITMYYTKE